MKKFIQILALVFVGVLTSSSLIAQTETVTPRFLTLSEEAGVTLPADPTGTNHGVRINRGYGVPETARAVVEPEEAEVVVPAPVPPRRAARRWSSW